MELTPKERERIYEEERVRREARGTSATDQLSGCVLWSCTGALCLLGIIILGFVLLCLKGLFWPDYR